MPGPQSMTLADAPARSDAETEPLLPSQIAASIALGVDIADTGRLKDLIHRRGPLVLGRLFTDAEQGLSRGASGWCWDSLAGRFAAKEAAKKVLAARGHYAAWTDLEILNGSHGEPLFRLHGTARAAAASCGFRHLLISISHERDLAVAVVLAL